VTTERRFVLFAPWPGRLGLIVLGIGLVINGVFGLLGQPNPVPPPLWLFLEVIDGIMIVSGV
jgi:hypothetical protein